MQVKRRAFTPYLDIEDDKDAIIVRNALERTRYYRYYIPGVCFPPFNQLNLEPGSRFGLSCLSIGDRGRFELPTSTMRLQMLLEQEGIEPSTS